MITPPTAHTLDLCPPLHPLDAHVFVLPRSNPTSRKTDATTPVRMIPSTICDTPSTPVRLPRDPQ